MPRRSFKSEGNKKTKSSLARVPPGNLIVPFLRSNLRVYHARGSGQSRLCNSKSVSARAHFTEDESRSRMTGRNRANRLTNDTASRKWSCADCLAIPSTFYCALSSAQFIATPCGKLFTVTTEIVARSYGMILCRKIYGRILCVGSPSFFFL